MFPRDHNDTFDHNDHKHDSGFAARTFALLAAGAAGERDERSLLP